ncbi:hypothetical protein CR203_23330 [Salipaludibacillus neizhouensis]|uniref:Uncharacterized protein n=1 Tax=Salipaludibacillus neizhouensis TaxID=885475 RepID=A0A3A9JVI7_9BACI|nr:hypothetical protein CR203_23330 [Salipaludibacillus neizhouensis]
MFLFPFFIVLKDFGLFCRKRNEVDIFRFFIKKSLIIKLRFISSLLPLEQIIISARHLTYCHNGYHLGKSKTDIIKILVLVFNQIKKSKYLITRSRSMDISKQRDQMGRWVAWM